MGFDRLFVAGQVVPLDQSGAPTADPAAEVLADRVILAAANRKRIIDSLEMAARFGGGRLSVHTDDGRHLPVRDHADDHYLALSTFCK